MLSVRESLSVCPSSSVRKSYLKKTGNTSRRLNLSLKNLINSLQETEPHYEIYLIFTSKAWKTSTAGVHQLHHCNLTSTFHPQKQITAD